MKQLVNPKPEYKKCRSQIQILLNSRIQRGHCFFVLLRYYFRTGVFVSPKSGCLTAQRSDEIIHRCNRSKGVERGPRCPTS